MMWAASVLGCLACQYSCGATARLPTAPAAAQAAAHATADAAYAAGMRRHQSDPVGAPVRLGELSGALIASLSSPNPPRAAAAAAAAAAEQSLASGAPPRHSQSAVLARWSSALARSAWRRRGDANSAHHRIRIGLHTLP